MTHNEQTLTVMHDSHAKGVNDQMTKISPIRRRLFFFLSLSSSSSSFWPKRVIE